ncbi:hypothetical protein [Herbaspirillum huttiense]|uniref:Uncharacterized protein n=1 Tax=Herbaspirillum huttiense subsp. lycopersici TaxID=3074428 RepID=A0ABU2EGL3_9BURK|nr:hypothetical protein [Herbaspirillum huttiense]MDR9847023.1 hypothetical protein [Herbaspirillum huttiense SE1]
MNVFSASTEVTVSVPLADKSGNALTVDAVTYRVLDQDDQVIVPDTPLTAFVAGSPAAVIVIPANKNGLADGVASALRNLVLECRIGSNTVFIQDAYGIEVEDPLVVGVNSFQTVAQARFTAMSLIDIPSWQAADDRSQMLALIEARANIVRLSFRALNSNVMWGQDSLNFVPEGTRDVNYVGRSDMFNFNGSLELLTPDQFKKLPTYLLDALRRAQVVEANEILGGDSIASRRRLGLVQDNVGESRQTFRQSKPLELPVCARAMRYLSRYVSMSLRTVRR